LKLQTKACEAARHKNKEMKKETAFPLRCHRTFSFREEPEPRFFFLSKASSLRQQGLREGFVKLDHLPYFWLTLSETKWSEGVNCPKI
jgi:hypothetical protein